MSVGDHYSVLGVTREVHPDVVRAAYYALVKKYHPDKTGGDPNLLVRFREITNAWETLSRPDKRAVYDRLLRSKASSQPPTPDFRKAASHNNFSKTSDDWLTPEMVSTGAVLLLVAVASLIAFGVTRQSRTAATTRYYGANAATT